MIDSFELLKEKFKSIQNKEYYKGVNNYKNSGGMTLEHLLNASGGDFSIPDFYDIEIKAVRKYYNKNIDLFNCAPDGSVINGTKWLAEKFGYPDKDYKNIKVLKGNIYANKLTQIGNNFLFKISIDYISKKVFLLVLNRDLRLLSKDIYWDFDSLKEKLIRKDSKLAIFEFYKKEINSEKYFRYTNLYMYMLKDFNTFLECIKNGKIYLVIKTGVFKTGKHAGNFKDHGSSFRIQRENIKDLFNIVH